MCDIKEEFHKLRTTFMGNFDDLNMYSDLGEIDSGEFQDGLEELVNQYNIDLQRMIRRFAS